MSHRRALGSRWRLVRRGLAGAVAAVLLLTTAAVATPAADSPGLATASVDPNLAAQLAKGPAPALFTWDKHTTRLQDVDAYLDAHDVPHRMFPYLSVAIGCARGPADLAILASTPGVRSVWGDEQMQPALDPAATTAFNGQPEVVWNGMGVTGKGVGIAVMDTGIDALHPDLELGRRTVINTRVLISHYELLGPGTDSCLPDTYQEDLQDSETVSGHGTHLAGVAAGDGTASDGGIVGMAPEADLVGISIVEQATPQVDDVYPVSLIRFIAGVNHVLTKTLDGGPTITKVALLGWTAPGLFDPWHPHYLAVRDLVDFGITVVMPVGNDGPEPSSCDAAATCHFNKLAVGQYPIAVGATPKDSRTVLEDYSTRGDPQPREVRGKTYSYEPTVVAPGSFVVAARRPGLAPYSPPLPTPYPLGAGAAVTDETADPYYQSLTGTSVSAAHVAGVIALMQQAALNATGCFLPPAQVKSILASTATAMPDYARFEVGSGAIDATAAVTAAGQTPISHSPDPWNCPPGGVAPRS